MTEKEQRILEIIDRIESLTSEANSLTQEVRDLRKEEPTRAAVPRAAVVTKKDKNNTNDHDFEVGDKVTIKNTYLGSKGTKGTVMHITKTQITLTDKSGKIHKRKYTNVKLS